MGFFSRLKWLFTGEGEAPASYKSGAAPRHNDRHSQNRNPLHPRGERGPRDRDNRDNRGGRGRDGRDSREPREGGRDHRDRSDRPRGSFNREGGDRERFNGDRDRQHGRRGGHDNSRRSSHDVPRQIERPTGGPSSTMRPAQSSAAEAAQIAAPRPVTQGPERVGVVSNYSDDARTAFIKVEKGLVRPGDWIEIQGSISTLRQKVESLQLDKEPVAEAVEGQEVSIRVIRPVKAGDAVVRLRG